MSFNMNTFNAPAAAMLDMAAFNSFLVQPPFGMSNIRAPVMVALGAQWTEKHHWSMTGHYTPKAEKQPLVGLGLGWPVGQSFISFIQELETLIVDPHSLDFLITPPLPSSTWTCTTSALNPKATAFVPRLSVSASNPPALNRRAAWFVPRHTTRSLNPSVIEYIPSLTAFGLNPRATEFIPHAVCRPNTSLKEITPRRARFPRAPRMVTPCVSEETWDCAEFMDTRASYGSFEEFGAHSQTDELASGFDPVAEKFVPHWVDPSIEAQELGEPIHSEMMRTRITKRGPGRTLQPQASQETWDCAEFMDSLERYDSNEEAVARIQPDDCACHPSTLASEFVPHQIRRSDATLEDTPRSIPMSRSVAMFKAGILDPPRQLKPIKCRGTGSPRRLLVAQDSAMHEYRDGERIDYYIGPQAAGSRFYALSELSEFDSHSPNVPEPEIEWRFQSEDAGTASRREDTSTSEFSPWIHLAAALLAVVFWATLIG